MRDLTEANLTEATLTDAIIGDTDFSDAKILNIIGVDPGTLR